MTDELHFKGARRAVLDTLQHTQRWLTVQEIAIQLLVTYAETGISSYLRELRKTKYGAHNVQCRLRAGTKRTYEYRLVPPSDPQAVFLDPPAVQEPRQPCSHERAAYANTLI